MNNHIVISQPYQQDTSDTISIHTFFQKQEKKKVSRRKRVSRRMAKKYPLFAVEFMQTEFPNIDYGIWEHDVITKKPSKAKRKGKSQLARQGRYKMYQNALIEYRFSNKLEDLQKAQDIRNRLYKDFELIFALGKERKTYRLPSTAPVQLVKRLAKIKGYSTWKQLDEMWLEVTRYEQY